MVDAAFCVATKNCVDVDGLTGCLNHVVFLEKIEACCCFVHKLVVNHG